MCVRVHRLCSWHFGGEIRGNNRTAGSGRQIDNGDRAAATRPISLFLVPLSLSGLGGRVEPPTPLPSRRPEPWGLPLATSNTPSARARSSQLEGAGDPRVLVPAQMKSIPGWGAAPTQHPALSHQLHKRALRGADSRFRARAGRPREVTRWGGGLGVKPGPLWP